MHCQQNIKKKIYIRVSGSIALDNQEVGWWYWCDVERDKYYDHLNLNLPQFA